MVKNFTFLLFLLILTLCMCSCSQASDQEYSITINNDIESSELDSVDVERVAVAPLYLPQQIDDNSINSEYHKSGLDAYINVDNRIIVKFTFVKIQSDTDKRSFPSVGEAHVVASLDYTEIYYRMSKEYGCVVTSETLPIDELERILNSFTIR